MTTASKTKSKQSFKDRFAKPQTTHWKGVMFNGEEAELEIRKITGVQELLAVRQDTTEYTRKAKAVQVKVEEAEAEGREAELDDADMAIIHEGEVLFGKILKRVVVLPEGENLTEDEWTTMASNLGGLQSPLWRVVANATGLGGGEVEKHDIPFSSGGSSK